jgi:AcrR family transcriptional regulator
LAQLDTQRIAAAALAVLDKKGVEGFTIRNVAESLRVTPMALYHHVRDKAALAVLVVDYANDERAQAPPTGDWREDLWEIARWTRQTTMAHPAVAHLRRMYRVWTPDILRSSERWIALWRQSGLDVETAVLAAQTSSLVISGMVDEEVILRGADAPGDSVLTDLPNARLLFRSRYDHDVMFELGVRSVIDGVHAQLTQNPSLTKRAKAKPKPKPGRRR